MSDSPETAQAAIPPARLSLEGELREVINRHSAENGSDTPDFILAQYLLATLNLFDRTVRRREEWYGRGPKLGTPPIDRRPTVEELEAILQAPDRHVQIMPDGTIRESAT